jgi:branched-subunit amino acid aminotransferase/4-amino-4-deoxychorismate lyase
VLVPPKSNILLYGKGVFTTVAIRDGAPFLWEKHWRRLSSNLVSVDIDLSNHSEPSVLDALVALIEENQIVSGRVRITVFDDHQSLIWRGESSGSTRLSIITGGVREVPNNFNLTVSPYPVNSRSPLAGIKSCNYLENILAMDEAKSRGFHEAVRVNERGHITGGCMSNIFWAKGGRLFTPALSTGCLPGTTREFTLENFECEEVEAAIGELDAAEAIYMTSAGIGIAAVAEFDGRPLPYPQHPITELFPTL